jgi:hypothetical protein
VHRRQGSREERGTGKFDRAAGTLSVSLAKNFEILTFPLK